jgi:LysM repeat protein
VEEGEGLAADVVEPGRSDGGPFRTAPDPGPVAPAGICQFLASDSGAGELEPPRAAVDPANRCIAIGEPIPQSSRQQELVCLTTAHVNCPRYLRGILIAGMPPAAPPREPVSRAVLGSTVVLAAAIAASLGFLAVHGGIAVELPSVVPTQVAVAPSVPLPPMASPAPTISIAPSPSPSPSASVTPAPTSTPTASPSPSPTPSPTRTEKPTPSSDRFAVLTKCSSTSDCWVYVIRAGDNLRSIANWFGVSYERILQMNPTITDPTTIHAGDHLRIPTPTR